MTDSPAAPRGGAYAGLPADAAQGNCSFEAWLDRQPPGTPVLHVKGECEFPTAGFRVELRRREPQGINPRDLLLEKVVQPPEGPVTQVITPVEVRYQEETQGGFDTVTILPDGGTIPVRVVT